MDDSFNGALCGGAAVEGFEHKVQAVGDALGSGTEVGFAITYCFVFEDEANESGFCSLGTPFSVGGPHLCVGNNVVMGVGED